MGHSFFSSQRNIFPALAILLIAVFFCYLPVLSSDFVNWDDDAHLIKNPFVRSLDGRAVSDIFTTTVNKIYIPLTSLSFALEYHFFGLNPFVYHLDNLLLHLAVTGMVLLLSLRCGLSPGASFIAALIFGVHPIHVESVAWVTERKDVLYSFFYMLSLLCYCRYLQTMGFNLSRYVFEHLKTDESYVLKEDNDLKRNRLVFLVLAFIFGYISVLAKPMALSLPLIFFLMDWFFRRNISLSAVLEKIVLGSLLLPVVWMTYHAQMRVPVLHWPDSALLWIWSAVFYLRKFFVPDYFVILYKAPAPVGMGNPLYLLSVLIFCCVIVSWARYRRNSLFVFALSFYAFSVFYLLRWDLQADANVVADRFMYLASVGLCMWIAVVCEYYYRRVPSGFWRRLLVGSGIGVVFLISWHTFRQCQTWRNSITLWEHQLKKQSQAATALIFGKLGQAYLLSGQYLTEANEAELLVRNLNMAIHIRPDYANPYYYLGIYYLETGAYDMAEFHLRKAIMLDHTHFDAFIVLGRLYQTIGDAREAVAAYERALGISPHNPFLVSKVLQAYERGARDVNDGDIYRRAQKQLIGSENFDKY